MRSLQIEGHPPTLGGLHAALVAAATAHIDDIHRAKCTPDVPLLFARMDCHGVGEDINQAVRMLAVAVSQRRQLILLPPPPRTAREQCKVPHQITLDAGQPWHWFSGQSLPLDSLFVLSSCQKYLLKHQPEIMEAIAASEAGNATQAAAQHGAASLAAASKEAGSLWRSHLAVSRHVPRLFQRQGLLWWFQVLTTYFVRVRGPLAKLLQAHPAMQPFLKPSATLKANSPTSASIVASSDAAADMRWWGWATKCGSVFCDGIGPGWMPAVRFDAGVHVRLGDACRSGPTHYSLHVRRCDMNLSVALRRLQDAGVRNGTLFVASDSQRVIDEIESGGAQPFNTSYLRISRTRFETAAGTERLQLMSTRLNSMVEALMDMLLLSRSSVLAGKMMSNFPRVALQLRVQMPRSMPRRRGANQNTRSSQAAYVALDDRPWCTRTSCREPFLSPREQQLATRRELARNPAILRAL